MGKTRDLFKKIRDSKGTFHAKMGSIKDRNCMDLTEADDTTLTAESEEEVKSLLMKVKVDSENQRRKGKIHSSECRVPKDSKKR